jgi:CRISPR/Cas system Type II protein with McrA/HNH and RuvC-like nuclease domain
MITREFKHAETLAEISDEVSMICNLQNIKHGLKTDFSDKQILETVLLKMDFTDSLIEQHLAPEAGQA